MKSDRFFFPFLILAVLAVVTGCNSNSSAPPALRPITLAVPSWYAPKKLVPLADEIEVWNADHPNRPAEVRVQFGKRDAIYQKILLGARRADFADAVLIRNEWLGRMVRDNLVRLLPGTTAKTVHEGVIPVLLPSLVDRRGIWAVPFDADARIVWVRKDLLAADPGQLDDWKLDALEVLAKNAVSSGSAKNGKAGFAFPAAASANAAQAFLSWYFSFGGRLVDSQGKVVLDVDAAVSVLTWLQSLVKSGVAPKNVAALDQNDVFSGLAGGAFGMTLGGTWERGMLRMQSELADQIVSFVLPGTDAGPGVCLVGGWSFVFPIHGNPQAIELVDRLFTKEFQEKKLQIAGLLPVRRDVLSDPWFRTDPDGPTFLHALLAGRALATSPDVSLALDRIGTMVAQVFLGYKTPREAASEAAAALAESGGEKQRSYQK